MLNIAKLKQVIKDNSRDFDEANIDLDYASDCSDVDELKEWFEERIREQDITYYSRAIAYLQEWDPSLTTSLGLAAELGYTTEHLNSETLATLLHQSILQDELNDLDFSDCFDEDEPDEEDNADTQEKDE